jgi:cell division protein FtsB
LGLVALLVLVAAAIPGVWNVYGKERESRELRTQAEIQAEHLSAQQAQLETDIARLQTERGKEAALREQYAIGKKGEGLIIIVDPPKAIPVEATSTVRQWVRKFLPFW